jgi:hypothetical protein
MMNAVEQFVYGLLDENIECLTKYIRFQVEFQEGTDSRGTPQFGFYIKTLPENRGTLSVFYEEIFYNQVRWLPSTYEFRNWMGHPDSCPYPYEPSDWQMFMLKVWASIFTMVDGYENDKRAFWQSLNEAHWIDAKGFESYLPPMRQLELWLGDYDV